MLSKVSGIPVRGNLSASTPISISNGTNAVFGSGSSVSINDATTSSKGAVQLSNSYNGTSQALAITEKAISDGLAMLNTLLNDNNSVLVSLLKAYKLAESSGEIGISNSIQDRITTHQKHGWMLKSLTK